MVSRSVFFWKDASGNYHLLKSNSNEETGRSAAAKTPNETSNDRVEIVSILPEAGTVLKVGDVVTVEVDVEYGLASADSGSIALVIQKGESGEMPLANEFEVIQKGEGNVSLSKEIEVPKTKAIQVFTPLNVEGSSSTTVVDSRIYRVETP